MQIKKPN